MQNGLQPAALLFACEDALAQRGAVHFAGLEEYPWPELIPQFSADLGIVIEQVADGVIRVQSFRPGRDCQEFGESRLAAGDAAGDRKSWQTSGFYFLAGKSGSGPVGVT